MNQRKAFITLALVFGISTAATMHVYLGQLQQTHVVAMMPLVTAKGDLKAYETLTPTDLNIVQIPAQSYPMGGVGDTTNLVGQTILISAPAGMPVLTPMVSKNKVDTGMRAIAVPANLTNSVAYTLKTGDRVDVLATVDKKTTVIAPDILITSQANDASNKALAYVLEVTPDQALAITLTEQMGTVQLIFRNVGDKL